MRIFCLSDIHVDYPENLTWLKNLSDGDYTEDVLILAGDVSHRRDLLQETFQVTRAKFARVLFVPGNHDLWLDKGDFDDSFAKFLFICDNLAPDHGIETRRVVVGSVELIPIYSWYDFSFGKPGGKIRKGWVDFRACRFPQLTADPVEPELTELFLDFTRRLLVEEATSFRDAWYETLAKSPIKGPPLKHEDRTVISYSHFQPRLDLLPMGLRFGYTYAPILGAARIDDVIREVGASRHVYGHSHINLKKNRKGIVYVNNAFGYPNESDYTRKILFQLWPA